MINLVSTAALLKRKLSSLASWDRENLLIWLAWHAGRSSLAVVQDGNKITGAAIARPISNLGQTRIQYHVEEGGSIVFVEKCVALNNQAFLLLLRRMKDRFPKATHILFSRNKSGHQMKLYPIEKFLKKVKITT